MPNQSGENRIDVEWHEVDRPFKGLGTDVFHIIRVKREAIPIIFVPGIMGSRLRLAGTNGIGEANGLPNLRWDPTPGFLYKYYSGEPPARRKAMLIGERFDPGFLEVANTDPVGDGFNGVSQDDYVPFLNSLRTRDWGAISKLFVFPVFGFGYNWTDTNRRSGQKLAKRIDEIIKEARDQVGLCTKVILVTHSMGGLVARAACHAKIGGAEGNVLGVIHGVMPAFGAAAAYWRMKAGFEGGGIKGRIASRFLGPTGRDVTALLANAIGGLELLPNKLYRTNDGTAAWLNVTRDAASERHLPQHGDPYDEIYSVRAEPSPGDGNGPSSNTYWGLVDPDLLAPERVHTPGGDHPDQLPANANLDQMSEYASSSDFMLRNNDFAYYLSYLADAESFHDDLGDYLHPTTWLFHGTNSDTADAVELRVETNWVRSDSYPTRGFRGFFRGATGAGMQAVLQDPAGNGDGTVPVSSATMLGTEHPSPGPTPPNNQPYQGLEHQGAYKTDNAAVQHWVLCAITALCKKRYQELR